MVRELAGVAGGGACFAPGHAPKEPVWENLRMANGQIARTPAEIAEAGKSTGQRVIEATDRAMAPWKLLNGLFGGVRVEAATGPAVPRAGRY